MRQYCARLWKLLTLMYQRFWDDRILQIAGSLTFTLLLSLVPVATVALTLLSALPAFKGMSRVIETWAMENLLPGVADKLGQYAQQFIDNAAHLTTVGLFFLAVTAIMLLMTIEDAFNDIWRVHKPRSVLRRILIYWALMAVGPVMIGASLSLSSWLMSASAGWTTGLPHVHVAMIKCSAVLLTSAALALLYYAMPTRPVRVRDALTGGL